MIVVDTNILVYSAIAGPNSVRGELLFSRDPGWAAPLLWRSEFRNVVAGHLRRNKLSGDEAIKATSLAASFLTAGEHAVGDAEVFDLVQRSNCTAYDCEFVALAIALNVNLVTEDRDLLKAFPGRCRSLAQALSP